MKRAVFVNGVPASGKSRVAARVTAYLTEKGIGAVPLALDTIKEALYPHIGTGDRAHNRMLGKASYQAIFASIADFPDGLVPVIDAWFGFQPEEVLRAHVKMAGIGHIAEVWCQVSPSVAADRYRARAARRHSGHLPASYADELFALASRAGPMALGPVVSLDTDVPVPAERFAEIHAALMG